MKVLLFCLFCLVACNKTEKQAPIIKSQTSKSDQNLDSIVYVIADTILGHNHIKIERHLGYIKVWRNYEWRECFFIPYDPCEGNGWNPLVQVDKKNNLHYSSIISLDSTRFVFAFLNGACRGVSEIFQVRIFPSGTIKLTDSASIPHWGLVDVGKQRLLHRSHLPYLSRFIKQESMIHEKMYIPITIISLSPKNMFALIKQYEVHEDDYLFNDLASNNLEKALTRLHKKYMNHVYSK